jgi:hypothetical protein
MRKLVLVILVAGTSACWDDDRPIQWERPRSVLGPIPLKTQVAYVDSALDRVTFVDLADDAPRITSQQIGRRALFATPSADRHRLFVITRGEEAVHPGEIDQQPMLWTVDPSGDAPPVGYVVGSPFDRLAISPDNKTAIAYFSDSGPDADGFFRNPNELAVVDLSRAPDDANPRLDTIRSFGSVPAGISLSPAMVVPGAADATPRTFAFIMSQNTLTILDASHPDRRDVSIRLDLGGTAVIPREVVFAPNTASAYVRSDNARDVLQVLLQPDEPQTPDGNDFRPQLAELGAGGGPTDIAVYDDRLGKRYLLASTPNTGEVVVIDADTAQFRSIPVADPIDRILLFPGGGNEPPTQALLASIGAKSSRLHVLDLTNINDPLAEAHVDAINLEQPVRDVVPVPGKDLALVVHDDERTVLGLLDMTTEATAPLLGVGRLDSYDFLPDGSHLIGATTGVSRVGFLALDNLHPTDFRLDEPPAKVLSTQNAKIFVDHGDPLGKATVIPSPTAERGDAIVLSGFLTNDLLDKGP